MAPASGRKNSDRPWRPEAPAAPEKKRYLKAFLSLGLRSAALNGGLAQTSSFEVCEFAK